jgi:hypothetical protein
MFAGKQCMVDLSWSTAMPHDPIVVYREPELVQREADRKFRGDTEKVATAGFNDINVRGVIVSSRYGKAYELETMVKLVQRLTVDQVGGNF